MFNNNVLETKKSTIYTFSDKKSGKKVVGQTQQPVEKRLYQYNHKSPMQQAAAYIASSLVHGTPEFELLSTEIVDEKDANEMEQFGIDYYSGLELFNKNHAPKTRNKNEMTTTLRAYTKIHAGNVKSRYELLSIYKWAKEIIEKSDADFKDCDFNSSFITFITNIHDVFEYDKNGFGDGFYTEHRAPYIANELRDNPEDFEDIISRIRVITNRYFFNSAEDKMVLTKLNKVYRKMESEYGKPILEKAKSNKEIAKAFRTVAKPYLDAKKVLEAKLKEVSLKAE